MAISAPGLGSGIDINSIISQLMVIESQPLVLLDTKEAGIQGHISALGSLSATLGSLQTAAKALKPGTTQTPAAKFAAYKASVADSTVLTASAAGTAAASSYKVEVLTLAHEHRLLSAADPTIESGARTITVEIGSVSGASFTRNSAISPISVELDGSDNSLEAIRDAINAKGAVVTASIVSATDGDRLTLTSKLTGETGVIRVTGGVSALNYDPTAPVNYDEDAPPAVMSELQAASDASIKLNGVTVNSSSNVFNEVLTGITLTVLKESASTTVTVTQDFAAMKSQLEAFIKAYNDANKSIGELGKYDAKTKVAGPLNGDSALLSSQSQLRSAINNVPSDLAGADLQRLSDVGISVQSDGSLKLDAAKFDTAVKANFTAVANLAAAYGTAFANVTDRLLGSGGVITSRTQGLESSVKDIDKQREALNLRLASIEKRYRAQYTALDTMVASMNQTADFLTQQLSYLAAIQPGANN